MISRGNEFEAWADSYTGRQAGEDEYERRRSAVARRPWHGASSSEMVVLRIALQLAPDELIEAPGPIPLDYHLDLATGRITTGPHPDSRE